MTRADRRAAGAALRQQVPRRAHGDWQPAAQRPDPVAVLEEQGRGRVEELLPIRYGRMVESPFGFHRGAAAIMAGDLADTPRTGLVVQACGDAHLLNFGLFATPERNLVFDVTDFDETLPAPWEWDLKRLGASLVVAARAIGASRRDEGDAALAAAQAYRSRMGEHAGQGTLEVWYTRVDVNAWQALVAAELPKDVRAAADRVIARAQTRDMFQAVENLTELVDGERRIKDRPPLIGHVPGEDHLDRMQTLLGDYRSSVRDEVRELLDRFSLVDGARKVVGVGSVGTRCWIALLEAGGDDDPLILQVKEAQSSVLERYWTPYAGGNHGQRVVEGQRMMQAASDIFLGWAHDAEHGTDYYWRQLQDMKGAVDIARMTAPTFNAYGALCGWVLARAHARSGDAAGIAGYLGDDDHFDRALARFASAYADENERDHAALVDAVRHGRITAQEGV